MSAVVRGVIGVALIIAGAVTGSPFLVSAGASLTLSAATELIVGTGPKQDRQVSSANLQLGEQPRMAVFGDVVVGGSLLDGFNYGGEFGTDWEVLPIAIADHRCEALVGFYLGDVYVPFAGNGPVAGYNGQLVVRWYDGSANAAADPTLVAHGSWSAADRLAGVAYVVVAYKADDPEAEHPVWPGGRPSFQWRVKGKRCYDPRLDDTVAGGAGPQRWANPATWTWTDNLAVCRYNWVRGIFARDQVDRPEQLLVGRGLNPAEAPPERVAAPANLCDELVALKLGGSERRYRVAAAIASDEAAVDVELKFAAACGGIITQPEGSVEIEPGQARAVVAEITDDDILVGKKVTFSLYRSESDEEWCNTVVGTYVEPAQQWKKHAAPVRRVHADILEDGRPRERKLALDYVTSGTQAQRCAEIARRLGRLTATGGFSLGPRFCELEEGDWIAYTSARRTRGQRLIFRIEAYQGDASWQTAFTLRQVAPEVYAWNPGDEGTDGAVVVQQAAPDDAYLDTFASRASSQGNAAEINDLRQRVHALEEQQP
ncbi:hypothetical protein GGQ80_000784 [Sphingomonas jinjuensis]|uniref:Tip attachment protein J domain-containing protein n=1 Tax=Sphingomonas jinjuensis TaxID=535907 RepID=A0A840F9C4_9SPHN|nr:phage tail protein [Sphingomonas jinjuensis]MBB4152896.1 hypothetical protein [Sphingomonas jinjuensis]